MNLMIYIVIIKRYFYCLICTIFLLFLHTSQGASEKYSEIWYHQKLQDILFDITHTRVITYYYSNGDGTCILKLTWLVWHHNSGCQGDYTEIWDVLLKIHYLPFHICFTMVQWCSSGANFIIQSCDEYLLALWRNSASGTTPLEPERSLNLLLRKSFQMSTKSLVPIRRILKHRLNIILEQNRAHLGHVVK